MKPFIQVPLCLSNSEGAEKTTVVQFQPSEVSYYYPGFHWGTIVVMKSGGSFLTPLDHNQFSSALDTYTKFVRKNPGKFGLLNIKLNPTNNESSGILTAK